MPFWCLASKLAARGTDVEWTSQKPRVLAATALAVGSQTLYVTALSATTRDQSGSSPSDSIPSTRARDNDIGAGKSGPWIRLVGPLSS
jgi:hypothetical protein